MTPHPSRSGSVCDVPPEGWTCSREKGHEGPCAALPTDIPKGYPSLSMALRIDELQAALEELADHHHRTITGSGLHDPERQDWRSCSCESCRKVVEVLGR